MPKKKAAAKSKKKPAAKKKAKAKSKPKAKAKAAKPAAKSKKPVAAKKKSAAKKSKKKQAPPALPWREALSGETLIGVVDDFFSHLNVVTLTLTGALNVGDKIHVRGHTTDNPQVVKSMQIERAAVSSAKAGDGVGILVGAKARRGDYVYRVR